MSARLRRAAGPLAATIAAGAAVSLLGELMIRAIGRAALGVPSSFKTLSPPDVFPYAFAPIVGCSVAFVVLFLIKRESARSRYLLLTVGIKFALLDGLIAILTLPSAASAGTIATVVAAVIYPLLIIPALLRFVPSSQA